jgi:hypothetical protein
MKRTPPTEGRAPGAAMEASPTPTKEMRRSLAMKKTVPSAKPEKDEGVDNFLTKLTKLMELVGGKVVSIEYENESSWPEVIHAEIPASQANTFYNKVKELGDLQPFAKDTTGKEQEVLPFRIHLISPK